MIHELIALAETIDTARRQANAIEATAPQIGVYGKMATALVDTLTLVLGSYSVASNAYSLILDGDTVVEAIRKVL